jgi:hypothetical protein
MRKTQKYTHMCKSWKCKLKNIHVCVKVENVKLKNIHVCVKVENVKLKNIHVCEIIKIIFIKL